MALHRRSVDRTGESAEPSHPLGTRLPTISGHTAYVFRLVKMTQSGEDARRPDLWHQG